MELSFDLYGYVMMHLVKQGSLLNMITMNKRLAQSLNLKLRIDLLCAKFGSSDAAFIHAAKHGRLDEVRILDTVDKVTLNKAIAVAIQNRHYETVKFLLNRGADVNHFTEDPFVQVHLITFGDDVRVLFIYKHNLYSLLMHALKIDDTKIVQLLVENGANVNYCDILSDYGDGDVEHYSILEFAVRHCGVDNVKFLIEHGAIPIESTESLLIDAAKCNNFPVLKYLVEYQGFSIPDESRLTGSIIASFGNLEIITYIWEHFEHALNFSSPLIYAINHNSYEVLEFLYDKIQNLSADVDFCKLIMKRIEHDKDVGLKMLGFMTWKQLQVV